MRRPKFQIGDRVKRTKPGGRYGSDYRFTIKSFVNPDGQNNLYAYCHNGSMHSLECLELLNPVVRPWEPIPGEEIYCTNQEDPQFLSTREFIFMDRGRYVCRVSDDQFFAYKHAKPMPKDLTITLANGAKVELSEESYNAIVNAAKEK